jgi:hypothetical protein
VRSDSVIETSPLIDLWLAKIRSAFEVDDIRGGRVTSYMVDDIRPKGSLAEGRSELKVPL